MSFSSIFFSFLFYVYLLAFYRHRYDVFRIIVYEETIKNRFCIVLFFSYNFFFILLYVFCKCLEICITIIDKKQVVFVMILFNFIQRSISINENIFLIALKISVLQPKNFPESAIKISKISCQLHCISSRRTHMMLFVSYKVRALNFSQNSSEIFKIFNKQF